ncbi:MAG: hypothetical protein PHC28_03565 [Flavobacterium sp.]|nr:hypothetical protein [Flavobacterium sp.]
MDENIDSSSTENSKLAVNELYDSNSNLKREFGKALMISLNESKSLRDLIKNKSLEMFDNDYEVLYEMIKNEKLENGLTLRESLLKNIGNENRLLQIEINNPTLTILVPELPENSFSAKLWNTDKEIPKVAIRLNTSNNVPIINQDGTEDIIEAKYTPGFPIIVIKENERVIVEKNKEFGKLKTRTLKTESSVVFKFLDNCFDKTKNSKKEMMRTVNSNILDPKIITAYNTYTGSNVDGWDRDYIYYGITPTTPKGPFKYDFQESIQSFSLQGDPIAAYNKIADQTNDPKFVSGGSSTWTGGNFEFKIRIIVNAKNGIGSEIIKYFNATPNDLFVVESRKVKISFAYFYINSIKSLRQMPLNIPIFNWDLDQYASSIKIEIEEVDLTETTVLTDTRTVKFATNFNIEGTLLKVGLKFGASLEQTTTHTVQKTYTQGNDALGEVIVNFADKIIISQAGSDYTTREYNSGLYSISVEPMRVQ